MNPIHQKQTNKQVTTKIILDVGSLPQNKRNQTQDRHGIDMSFSGKTECHILCVELRFGF